MSWSAGHCRWSRGEPSLLFVLLSPSSGPAVPPTLRRCDSPALSLGCGAYRVAHRFGFPGRDPRQLVAAGDAGVDVVGPGCDGHLAEAAASAEAHRRGVGLVGGAAGAGARGAARPGRGRAASGPGAGGPARVPQRRAGRRARASAVRAARGAPVPVASAGPSCAAALSGSAATAGGARGEARASSRPAVARPAVTAAAGLPDAAPAVAGRGGREAGAGCPRVPTSLRLLPPGAADGASPWWTRRAATSPALRPSGASSCRSSNRWSGHPVVPWRGGVLRGRFAGE